jgi:hypothetical protein
MGYYLNTLFQETLKLGQHLQLQIQLFFLARPIPEGYYLLMMVLLFWPVIQGVLQEYRRRSRIQQHQTPFLLLCGMILR